MVPCALGENRHPLPATQAVGVQVPSAQQVLVVGGAVWQCAASLSMPEPALLKALLAATQQQPCRVTLPGPGVRTAGEASLLAVGVEGCGKWIPQEFAACHPDPSAAFSTAAPPRFSHHRQKITPSHHPHGFAVFSAAFFAFFAACDRTKHCI